MDDEEDNGRVDAKEQQDYDNWKVTIDKENDTGHSN